MENLERAAFLPVQMKLSLLQSQMVCVREKSFELQMVATGSGSVDAASSLTSRKQ